MTLKLRNVSSQPLEARGFGAGVVEPDEVFEVRPDVEAEIAAGALLVDTSTWAVVEGVVPPPPSAPEVVDEPPAVEPEIDTQEG